MTLLLSSLGTGYRYFKMLLTCLKINEIWKSKDEKLGINGRNSCYYSWARRQSLFCLRLHADEVTQNKMAHQLRLSVKTADNCNAVTAIVKWHVARQQVIWTGLCVSDGAVCEQGSQSRDWRDIPCPPSLYAGRLRVKLNITFLLFKAFNLLFTFRCTVAACEGFSS